MGKLANLFGWIGLWGYVFALLNYFVKYINKRYINKIGKNKFTNAYRGIMKYIVKYHKIAGIIATASILIHFYLMLTKGKVSVTGVIAALIMIIVAILGVYYYGIKKRARGSWVKVHKILSIILIVFVVFHVLFAKAFLVRLSH